MPSPEAKEVSGEDRPGRSYLMSPAGLPAASPLTKLVELDGDVRPYLATLMVAALARVGETLVVLEGTRISTMTREAFDNMLLKEAGRNYDNYGLVSR